MKHSDKSTKVSEFKSNDNYLTRTAKTSPQLILGIVLTGFVLAITVVSFFWTPWDPIAIDIEKRLLTPSFSHWFGTLVSTLIGVVLGTSLGLASAGSGPRWGGILTRISDVGIAIPSILIALVLATTLGPGRLSVIIAISFWFVPVTARVVVGPARQILSLDFVEAAMTHGRSRLYIVFRQVLPNIAPIVIVQTSMMFAAGILIEASLSFLGVGAQPPTTSWGKILMDSQPLVQEAPYYTLLPGSFVVITVLGFNLLGDGLAVLLDPQQSQKGVA